MGLEAKYTAPLVGVSSAANRCSKVLFPAPDGATIATISPRRKLKFASAKTVSARAPTPYVFFRLRASSTICASRTPPKSALAPALPSAFIRGPHFPCHCNRQLQRFHLFRCTNRNSSAELSL